MNLIATPDALPGVMKASVLEIHPGTKTTDVVVAPPRERMITVFLDARPDVAGVLPEGEPPRDHHGGVARSADAAAAEEGVPRAATLSSLRGCWRITSSK